MTPTAEARAFIGSCVLHALQTHGVKQNALAAKLKVAPNTVSNWVTGQTDMAAGWLVEIAEELDMGLAEFFARPLPASAKQADVPAARGTADADLIRDLAPLIGPLAEDAPDLIDVLRKAKERADELVA